MTHQDSEHNKDSQAIEQGGVVMHIKDQMLKDILHYILMAENIVRVEWVDMDQHIIIQHLFKRL